MTSDTEQSLFENLVLFIPERKACADILMGIAISANAVFALNCQFGVRWEGYTQRKTLERA